MIKKDIIIAVLVTFILTAAIFGILPSSSIISREYDPWVDTNDDGRIDMRDIGAMCDLFGRPELR